MSKQSFQAIPAKDLPEIHKQLQRYLLRMQMWVDKGLILEDNTWEQYQALGYRIYKEQRNGNHGAPAQSQTT